jgi:hypothetical protein
MLGHRRSPQARYARWSLQQERSTLYIHAAAFSGRPENIKDSAPKAQFFMSSQEFSLRPEDFSVIVKRRDKDPTPWKWEIWAACRNRPAHRSATSFATASEATRAGKAGLQEFLKDTFPDAA